MLKLFCAVVGVAESVFHVDIEPGETVSDLKSAITEMNKDHPILKNVAAKNLRLFLAKKGGGWLSREDSAVLALEKGEIHPDILDMMDTKPIRANKTLQFWIETNEMPQPSTDQIHVLVVVPEDASVTVSKAPYLNRHPKAFVNSEGAAWDFQNPLDNEQLSDAIRMHYDAWTVGKRDEWLHPLFTCWSGPGTGKSRLLDEFPMLLKNWLFAGKTENPDMIQLLQNAFTFNITFVNPTPHEDKSFLNAAQLIGTRMLYQLQDSLKWDPFVQERSRHSVSCDVMEKLSKITGSDQRDMCVIICVDGLQKLTDSEFDSVLKDLTGLVNASNCWVIAICSATIYRPVKNCLVSSSQLMYELPTGILSRPTVEGEDIFATFIGDELIELLIDDMGGLGRALEVLHAEIWKARRKGSLRFMSVMRAVLTKLWHLYSGIEDETVPMQEAFRAVMARSPVDKYSRFGKLSLDEVISTGLVRREGRFLTCPYVLYLLVKIPDCLWENDNYHAPQETREDAKPWQTWETFNCKFRVLKSVACQGKVKWTDIHCGARFGTGCDRDVIEQPREYVQCKSHMMTKLAGFGKGITCPCYNDREKYFLYQPAPGSPSGDAFTCMKDAVNGFFHEVHQCKKIKDNFPEEDFLEEKEKAAGPDDLFILYCTSKVEVDIDALDNCAVVDSTCWKEYYGPFAARAFFVSTVPPPDINNSATQILQLVPDIGPAISRRIVEKRPYSSLQEAHEKTKVSMKILKRLKI